MLLYSNVEDAIHATYYWRDQDLVIKAIYLEQEWVEIEEDLLSVICSLSVKEA